MQKKRMILASASPRRKELMQQAGYDFEIQVSHKEENYISETPEEIVKELALLKATDVAGQNEKKELIVIGADTVVSYRGAILGKPKSKDDAFRMIQGFQGDKHQVYTGVAILSYDAEGEEHITNYAVKTDVYVNAMTEDEIWNYIEHDHVLDKAGSYGIQSGFAIHIEKIEGDYFNVVGLPISSIYKVLKEMIKQEEKTDED